MLKAVVCSSVLAGLASLASAECPNGCNGHGKCTSYDMCVCNRNWQANDCSERVCQFGLAHVDTPKGDLNMDNDITGPDYLVSENSFTFPYGTSEQFPQGRDSDLIEVKNSAHYYMECSNKGSCNRDTGECECLPGYDGAACQRASCPGYPDSCSGHGVCKTIRQLANADNGNIYELWDRHSTMGCECDEGFDGPDCSERVCKFGIDPLYFDDSVTIKYAAWDFAIVHNGGATNTVTDNTYEAAVGEWAIRFFDMHGEDWVTEPLSYGASCNQVTAALEALPNNVVHAGSLTCVRTAQTSVAPRAAEGAGFSSSDDTTFGLDRPIVRKLAFQELESTDRSSYSGSAGTADHTGYIYRVKFAENPGDLKEPEIVTYLDGVEEGPTIVHPSAQLVTKVWTDGQQGESVDYFADHCEGVTVTIDSSSLGSYFLSGMTSTEVELLKSCLGSSDFDLANNVDKYDWDHGSIDYPHLVKLVLTTASYKDGGYYVALYFVSGSPGAFYLINNFQSPDRTSTDQFEVYTTKGTLARASSDHYTYVNFASNVFYTNSEDGTALKGDISCEINDNNAVKRTYYTRNTPDAQTTCLNKTDIFTFFSYNNPDKNPEHINLYTVEKIYQRQFSVDNGATNDFTMTYTIETDISSNWGVIDSDGADDEFQIYKFFPSTESTYTYVSQCSNRGLCSSSSGLCECFHGYTGDSCSDQNSLAV